MRPRATDDVAPRGASRLDLAPAALAARRLGVYGGSFDPPHAGHLWVAERAKEAFDLDHVVFVPARRPPHKPGRVLAPDGDRLAMLALLFGRRDWVSAWPGELRRAGPSYTFDTLATFRAGCAPEAELFLVLGSDNLSGLPRWHRAEELLGLAQPIVVRRTGAALDASALEGAAFADLDPALRARVRAGFVEVEVYDVTATDLRARLEEGGSEGPDGLVRRGLPPELGEYIRLRRLYRR